MSAESGSNAKVVRFGHGTPIFRVGSLPASIGHYVRVLGFALDWEFHGIFASVSRGKFSLFLCENDQGHPGTWAWIGVNDADAVFDEYRASGAAIRRPPTNFPWAYEMQVEDPDGNVLRLGSDPKAGEPEGEWLDMYGKVWGASTEDSTPGIDGG